MTLQDHIIEIIAWGIVHVYWPRKKNLQFFFQKSLQKIALCVYGEYAKLRKSIEINHFSDNNRAS